MMVRKPKSFDAVAFKDEMQRLAEKDLEGLDPGERRKRVAEAARSGPLGEWWRGLPVAPVRGRRQPAS